MGCIVPYRRKYGHFVTFAVVTVKHQTRDKLTFRLRHEPISDSLKEFAKGAILLPAVTT